ncbi:MAG: alpha/beta fold hydrolase, partial [Acidimicrobiia bacterium]
AQSDLFAALLEHWDLDAPHVLAHDFGGAVALRSHLLDQRNFRSLALVDVVALRPWGSPFFRLVGEHPDVFVRLPEALQRAVVREYVSGAAFTDLAGDVLDGLVAPWTGPTGQAAFYRQIAQADERYTDEIEGRLSDVRCPTLIVWGTDDAWIPVGTAHRLHSVIPGSELRLIERAGHLVHEDRPGELRGQLTAWLSSQA